MAQMWLEWFQRRSPGRAARIIAGGGGSCAIERVTAQVFCWGNRSNLQLSNGANFSGTERSAAAVLGPLLPEVASSTKTVTAFAAR
jgi:hypothetical protein